MNIIYGKALSLAWEQKTVVTRLDVQFNYATQTYGGCVWLANGKRYKIFADGTYEDYE